ncbi:RIT1 [Candida jiufengensis]|uniref:RIT1 n=1 Tax=Candida jiufengensis TaxID=497108 RepID=UPI002224454A|nr:RIT1 [Candida jiufengensis]KAI5952807.1 RIT1 [Candida jiufengensis]
MDSTIIFNKNNDINLINKELKKSSLSFKNRLQSIIYDSKFVQLVHENLEYPIIANERCGLWYTPTNSDTCYFKSTDGHTNVWSFSTRRLNLHLLPIIQDNGGIMIVDSTRRGKPIPDALSKTIPIWCAVLNTILYEPKEDYWLRLPDLVPKSEYNSILNLIPSFIEVIRSMNLFTKETHKLDKPLLPRWFYPGCSSQDLDDSVYNICLVSASKQVPIHKTMNVKTKNASVIQFDYVQGSADDHELWVPKSLQSSFGPIQFWKIFDQLVDKSTGYIPSWMNQRELEESVQNLLPKQDGPTDLDPRPIGDTGIYFGSINRNIEASELSSFKTAIILSDEYKVISIPGNKEEQTSKILQYNVPSNKKGSNLLRTILPDIMSRIDLSNTPIVLLCGSGKDISVGVVLAILCTQFDLDWNRLKALDSTKPSKTLVKQHLSKISNLYKVNPSRSTLQSINNYLFSNT